MNITGEGPINTSDTEEYTLEEDPELADDLRNIILDKRGKDQPCPVGTAANSAMDPQAEVVASAPSLDAATLPTKEDLEPADDLCNVILDERGKDQPCPAGTAADSLTWQWIHRQRRSPVPQV